MTPYQAELYHHGVKGMKWGVRRSRNSDLPSNRKASNYSEQQRVRDRKIYGKGAENRINKRMLEGESIQSARHNEVKRKERIDSGKAVVKSVAKGALVVGGAAAVATLLHKKGFGNAATSEVLTEQICNVGRHVVNGILK